jgi:hypothetical protein
VNVLNPDDVPGNGGGLLVRNPVSLVDTRLILASTRRLVRFLLPQELCALWWLKPCLPCRCVLPLQPESEPRELTRALYAVRDAKGEA